MAVKDYEKKAYIIKEELQPDGSILKIPEFIDLEAVEYSSEDLFLMWLNDIPWWERVLYWQKVTWQTLIGKSSF